ncbi:MAG: hypothetical protein KDC95_13555 [Planctomycetes bacterium]|nr:hypothetical protein [Planctomycetota bacterium]
MDTVEGNQVFYHWGSTGRSLTGIGPLSRPRALNQLAFRRDGSSPSGNKRTLDADVTLSTGSLLHFIGDTATMHGPDKTLVLSQTALNFPDWTTSAGSPAPFDFVLKFQKPFVYVRGDLIWSVYYTNPSDSGLAVNDREWTGPQAGGSSVVGTGCGSFTHTMQLENNGPGMAHGGMRIRVNATGTQANTPTWLLVDFTASNLSVGLCANLYASPTIMTYLTTTNATGGLPYCYVGFPYIAAAQSATIVTQILSLDPTQSPLPLALSDGRSATMPSNSSTASKEAAYMWSSNPTTTGTVFFGGSLCVELK